MGLSQTRSSIVVILTVVCVVIVLGFGELGIRLFVKNGDVTPAVLQTRSVQYDPAIFARHVFTQEARTIEHVMGVKKGVVWEINEKGYRGPNFETKKPDGVIRIIVYGGSAAFDMMVSEGEDWPHLVERKLRDSGFSNVEVINAGIMGHTAIESVGRLFTEGFVYEPDYVMIYNAWNDIKYLTSPKTVLRTLRPSLQEFDPRIRYSSALDSWLCDVSQLYTVLRRIYYKTTFKINLEGLLKDEEQQFGMSEINPTGFHQYRLGIEMFADLAFNIGATPILVTQARLVHASNTFAQKERLDYHHVRLTHETLLDVFDRFDTIVRDVATEKKAILIDASEQLTGKNWAFYDQVHFDLEGRGSEVMSQLIADRLKEELLLATGQ